ncbi:serine/threonine-protein kinase [Glycomyces harbinensis]|uniref:non-specific serine/threonine protein kinase n=1 Tax=Glycomyces harbinensis TaxID=58114 RepID=A0A1G6R622_9ACTN|nr:serine/threonine-protein kinase [Glycomyces harbinensis]SDC99477.1 serine/threonine protein kinase [Glycomyces harbinensis]
MEPGTLIADRYRLDETIASGGMGTVWRGFDLRLKRAVAIKILKTGFEDDDVARARFEHEAQSVAALRHTGIAALYDYSEMQDETGAFLSYLVMELIEGRSLTARLLDGPMAPAEAMRLCAQVAEALQCAHEAGIIHRDVKPANIILDNRGRAVLVDFGIALSAGRTAITETGMLLGTLYYASPEQLEGRELNFATDIYSLGAVTYECLAGNPPFTGDTAGTILNGHLNQPPPQLPETVPPAPAATVFRALAKRPDQRWPSAAALAEASGEAIANPFAAQPLPSHVYAHVPSPATHVTPPGPEAPTSPNAGLRKTRRGTAIALVGTVLAIAGLAVALMFSPWFGMAEGVIGEQGTFGALDWRSNSGAEAMDSESPSSAAPSTSDATSAEETEHGEGGPTTEAGEDDEDTGGGGGEATEEESDDAGSVDGGAANLPDVWGIWYTDAWNELYEAGWENLKLERSTVDPENGATDCSVLYTDPEGGTPTHYDELVTITYLEINDNTC